jgi:hypothetical protein
LEVHHRVAGLFFALAQIREQFIHAVTACGGQSSLMRQISWSTKSPSVARLKDCFFTPYGV